MGVRQQAARCFLERFKFSMLVAAQRANMSVCPVGVTAKPSTACPASPASPLPNTLLHVVLAALSCTSVYLWLHYRKLLSRFLAACQQPFARRPSRSFKAHALALTLAHALAPAIYLADRRMNRMVYVCVQHAG